MRDALDLAWQALADAECEHDQTHALAAWEALQSLPQQRTPDEDRESL